MNFQLPFPGSFFHIRKGVAAMNSTRKLVLTAILCAVAVATSSFLSIRIGMIQAFPIQHLINIFLAVLVGTKYAVSGAFLVSLLRNLLGLGSLFAFPGSMVGALLAGLVYKQTKNLLATAIAEVVGTGLIGAILAYPIATFILGREVSLFFIMPAFLASSAVGATISFVLLKILMPRLGMKEGA